eukprot:SAG11_NODE_383_length_9899_cov_10.535510_9_plen_89_part_00
MRYSCVTRASLMRFSCVTHALHIRYPYVIYASPMRFSCVTCVSHAFSINFGWFFPHGLIGFLWFNRFLFKPGFITLKGVVFPSMVYTR